MHYVRFVDVPEQFAIPQPENKQHDWLNTLWLMRPHLDLLGCRREVEINRQWLVETRLESGSLADSVCPLPDQSMLVLDLSMHELRPGGSLDI